ncbi:uncharacterized protein AMSG_06841 [Thecamonas trahens ATCC 50062]|uniref:Uncharacterized protein n=1 Tax=Thecamonas trahens ATCC 50062 TaxID=461836 RepID=A0A0L0DG80_THETB|nr:hypothetical protein AMSG_06841 [Thecamonas trahens ATCC 50062]KNC50353.1 hypothetical protein AMSG_06841 [Thecamonas trahens ATCC 50062]|eukprot:XP_013756897.1 hypothetical protein AMSG_06841 [Thecamonas trahens ATCC 50062]
MGAKLNKLKSKGLAKLAEDPSKFQEQVVSAVESNDEKKTKIFMEVDKNANYVLNYDELLSLAITNYDGEGAVFDLIMAAGKADVNKAGEGGNTPLHQAINAGKAAAGVKLVDAGASVATTNEAGQTPAALLEAKKGDFSDEDYNSLNGKLSGDAAAASGGDDAAAGDAAADDAAAGDAAADDAAADDAAADAE